MLHDLVVSSEDTASAPTAPALTPGSHWKGGSGGWSLHRLGPC